MWRMKTEIIPVVIRALGLIKKGLEKYMEKNPWGNQHQQNTKHNFIRNSPHTKEGFSCQPCYAPGPWFGPVLPGVYRD